MPDVFHGVDQLIGAPQPDAQVLPGGTGYLTDLGMCGDYDSVIGMIKKPAIARMKTLRALI